MKTKYKYAIKHFTQLSSEGYILRTLYQLYDRTYSAETLYNSTHFDMTEKEFRKKLGILVRNGYVRETKQRYRISGKGINCIETNFKR